MKLNPTAANLRAELARYNISRVKLAEMLHIHPNTITNHVGSEYRPLPDWLAHNLGYAVNVLTGESVFNVEMEQGVLPPPPSRGWSKGGRLPARTFAEEFPAQPRVRPRGWREDQTTQNGGT